MSDVRVGVCGLGFMGRTHLEAFAQARELGAANRITAVADRNASKRRGELGDGGNIDTGETDLPLFDPEAVEGFERPEDLVTSDAVDLVSICTPTDSHVDLALAALEAGKHVLVEKPIALDPSEVQRLADAARASDRVCMPAMCIRFWPGWDWLKQAVDSGELGRCKSLVVQRRSPAPGWSQGFYKDPERTGGALFDLHIHDADWIQWIFGAPEAVTTNGDLDHVQTLYYYGANGPDLASAEGGWDFPSEHPFQMGYSAVFENGAADFSLHRESPLLVTRGDRSEVPELAAHTGYVGEVLHLLDVLAGRAQLGATIDQAAAVTRLLSAERESLESRRTVEL